MLLYVEAKSSGDTFVEDGIYSEDLYIGGTSLCGVGKAFAWIYCNTKLVSLCQGNYRLLQNFFS